MKVIVKERGTGKTLTLIHTSEATGFRIITKDCRMAEQIKSLAKTHGNKIPDPMSVKEYSTYKGILHDSGILIDEFQDVIGDILDNYFGTHVYAGTMSDI